MSNKLIPVDEFSKKVAKEINNQYKARQAFCDVALGNNTKLSNLAKMAIQEAENEPKREWIDLEIEEVNPLCEKYKDQPYVLYVEIRNLLKDKNT